MYFNPRSHCRERRKAGTRKYEKNFNPRSHCRERQSMSFMALSIFDISIHVPIAGNDHISSCRYWFNRDFNPRSHCRERLEEGGDGDARRDISIHVPIAGNDGNHQPFSALETSFQSTFPLQGTTANLSNF